MTTASSVLKEGCTAVITGASSGIGRAMAMECSTRGMNVWMVDIDKDELTLAAELVTKAKTKGDAQVGNVRRSLLRRENRVEHGHGIRYKFPNNVPQVTRMEFLSPHSSSRPMLAFPHSHCACLHLFVTFLVCFYRHGL